MPVLGHPLPPVMIAQGLWTLRVGEHAARRLRRSSIVRSTAVRTRRRRA